MRRLPFFKITVAVIITLLFTQLSFSQEATVTIEQDPQLETLLKERKRLLKKEEIRTHFTIQVFSGEIEGAQKVLKEYKQKFNDYKSQIHWQTPNYKVWVGHFRNRLDADRALLKISEEFQDTGAFVFEPENKKRIK